jgi:hypothetical protein
MNIKYKEPESESGKYLKQIAIELKIMRELMLWKHGVRPMPQTTPDIKFKPSSKGELNDNNEL